MAADANSEQPNGNETLDESMKSGDNKKKQKHQSPQNINQRRMNHRNVSHGFNRSVRGGYAPRGGHNNRPQRGQGAYAQMAQYGQVRQAQPPPYAQYGQGQQSMPYFQGQPPVQGLY